MNADSERFVKIMAFTQRVNSVSRFICFPNIGLSAFIRVHLRFLGVRCFGERC